MKKVLWTALTAISLLTLLNCKKDTLKNSVNTTSPNQIIQDKGEKKSARIDKSNDPDLKKLQAETLNKFSQLEFNDPLTGSKMSYNLFIPKNYNKSKSYPLVLFMADASTVGKATTAPLIQGYGGIVWATDESQAQNPCFVLVPQYTTKAVNDDFETSDEVEMTLRLLNNVTSQYNIDTNRLYTTGQSMGGMMSMYFNITHPDLFAASIFVGCQWDTSKMESFAKNHFFYIVAAGDEKAPQGMKDLKAVLEKEGAQISTAEWNAKLPETQQNLNVEKLLSKDNDINFITFTKGSVLPPDGSGTEHMWSFDYAYKIKAVRDWLFAQKK
ncbi:carboxylesterase family protein [Chryseobacterium sp. CT-SW4]|uniref:carboxylesterase family protein n=1 Tax=Chryseobacterium sp. SW-1 TaxID=3157343 RepID=UPI003B01AE60